MGIDPWFSGWLKSWSNVKCVTLMGIVVGFIDWWKSWSNVKCVTLMGIVPGFIGCVIIKTLTKY